MSQQRGNRPRSWCPRGDSPLRLPEGGPISSPVAAPGVHGLPPAVASPRSTPTPFKLRRLSMGGDRAGSPLATPATVLPALHMAAAQLEQHQQRQAAQQAAAHAASQAASQIEQITTQLSQQHNSMTTQQQQQTVMTNQVIQQTTQQQSSGVFYPVPQHPGSPPPLMPQKAAVSSNQ